MRIEIYRYVSNTAKNIVVAAIKGTTIKNIC
jgi:hypothetical protein